MGATLRQQVTDRAGGRCEYCRMPHQYDVRPFQLDHIRAQKHRGETDLANLAFCCLPCNAYKGSNIAGYDPVSGELVALFNPRRDDWAEHFEWEGATLAGKTAVARATIDVLRINAPERTEHRQLLIDAEILTQNRKL